MLFKDDALDPVTADGYFSQPRPSARDVRIAAILRQWSQLPELDRRRAELDLDESRLEVLEVFAERMASTAVATRDPEALRNACDQVVRVPIYGHAESLHLAMAATICVYASASAERARPNSG